jgi:hypothetical protein
VLRCVTLIAFLPHLNHRARAGFSVVFLERTAAFLPHLIVRAPALRTTGDDEYKEMVCIEAAAVERAISVAAGEQWEAGQTLTVESV